MSFVKGDLSLAVHLVNMKQSLGPSCGLPGDFPLICRQSVHKGNLGLISSVWLAS